MRFNLDKLADAAKPTAKKDVDAAASRKANGDWIRLSQEIALVVHCYLNDMKMTKTTFAKKMDVSPSYIGKLLKGNENLTLETICKLEKIMGRKLIYTSRSRRYGTADSGMETRRYFSDPQAEYCKDADDLNSK